MIGFSRMASSGVRSIMRRSSRCQPGLDPALRTGPLPIPTPEIPAVMAWHARHDRDAAHRWLRTTITGILEPAR